MVCPVELKGPVNGALERRAWKGDWKGALGRAHLNTARGEAREEKRARRSARGTAREEKREECAGRSRLCSHSFRRR